MWQLKGEEESNLDRGLPADGGSRRKPWLLHSLDVKEMTFCGIDVVSNDEVLALLELFLTVERFYRYFLRWSRRVD